MRHWGNTEWKQLSNGESVNVLHDDEIALVSVVFTDPHEKTRDFPLSLNGRVIDHIEVNGKRYIQAPEYSDNCEVLD
jgi:hypothetical protein